ncbi:MAG: hypothetical protein Q7S92_01380 [Candidatus Diapherotrites archaeon]|nr:hypothetical protein [Candidatus Diapherotrites archaeon]
MISLTELQFAVKYSFTNTAKQVMKELDLPLENIPQEIQQLAVHKILQAFQRKKNTTPNIQHQEILRNHLLSFPVTKIILASIQDSTLNERFSQSMADSVFECLEQENNKSEIFKKICRDSNIEFQELQGIYALNVIDYLSANPLHPKLRLINQSIQNGKVFLSSHLLSRWISALARKQIQESLNQKPKNLPKSLETIITQTENQIQEIRQKMISTDVSLEGHAVQIELFPECMRSLYLRLNNGENLPHMARFFLASFLTAIHMPLESILDLFRKAPNFDERTTRYHLLNIEKKGYTPPSSAKLREHGLACNDCGVTHNHPLTYYKKELSKIKPKKK